MSETSPSLVNNVQNTFLEHIKTTKQIVNVYLANGIRLRGCVTAFDAHTILLTIKTGKVGEDSVLSQLLYKRAIATIKPGTDDEPHNQQAAKR